MPPKVHDTRPSAEEIEAIETETAQNARRIIATYSEDFLDGVTLMSMLGVEPTGLVHRKVLEELDIEPTPSSTTAKKTTKKTSKKATAKKSTKKTTKKTTAKKSTKKTTKKS